MLGLARHWLIGESHTYHTISINNIGSLRNIYCRRLGRRTFLLIGASLMTLSLVTLSGLTVSFNNTTTHKQCDGGNQICNNMLYYDTYSNHNNNNNNNNYSLYLFNHTLHPLNSSSFTTSIPPPSDTIPTPVKVASLIALFVFVLGFSVGYGPIVWLLLSEIFPTGRIRAWSEFIKYLFI